MCELGPEPSFPEVKIGGRFPALCLFPRLLGRFRLHGMGTGEENFGELGRTAAAIPTPSRDLSLRTDWCRWVISAWILWSFLLRSIMLPLSVFLACEVRSIAAYWGT